jgi:hypothetical protein
VQLFADGIAGARGQIFANSSHVPLVEESDAYDEAVTTFLNEIDASSRPLCG